MTRTVGRTKLGLLVQTVCQLVVLAVLAVLAAGCYSSNDPDYGGNPPPENRTPTAVAGPNLDGMTGDVLTLDGSGSSDPDGDALVYEWSVVSGPANGATLTDASAAVAGFSATVAGTYEVSLVVRDAANASSTATISIAVAERPAVASLAIDRSWVFLADAGATTVLAAHALDAQGAPVAADITWHSTAPDEVFVDANGELLAAAIGSALVFAEAGGVQSPPTLVFVAETVPGTLLLADAQVVDVGEPEGVPSGTPLEVGMHYPATFTGLSALPAPGTVVLATGVSPVAGKVVSAESSGNDVDVVLELVPLYELLARYHIDWTIDLKDYPLRPVDGEEAAGLGKNGWRRSQAAAPVVEPFEAFECDGEATASLLSSQIALTPQVNLKLIVQDYRDDPALMPGYSKHALTGSEMLVGTVGIKLKANISASGSCVAQAKFDIPVAGWISILVMPAVRLGLGVELAGTLTVAEGEISATGKVGSTQTLGWACGDVTAECHGLDDISLSNDFEFAAKAPSINGMHVDASGHFFVLLGLDLVFLGTEHAKIIEARIGPKQSIDLGLEDDQAKNESYASNYELKVEGIVEPGSALKAAIKKLIDDDAVGVTFKGQFAIEPTWQSPRGSLEVSQQRVALGNPVDFTVRLDAATANYPVIEYNVEAIELWRRKADEFEFTGFHVIPVSASNQSQFQYRWEPTAEDVGKSEFAAFVRTRVPVTPILEVTTNSVREVEVSCFTSGALAPGFAKPARGAPGVAAAAPDVCADEWIGSSTHILYDIETSDASITWRRDPTFVGLPGQVQYIAEGTLEFHHLIFEAGGCTVTPTVFTIGPPGPADANNLIVDYAFSPAAYGGHGIHATELTVSCPDQDPFTVPASLNWLNDAGVVSDDGLVIEGGVTTPAGTSSYRFERP